MRIKELFAANRDIYRSIEKVISYGADQEAKLKSEISEYIVTDAIEDELHDILEKMDRAMSSGEAHEVGVWVSGFYGSGKSSFTKYLGLALDKNITIDGTPFLTHLADRCQRATTKALLSKVASAYPATVVFLSLDSESLAGAEMKNVSTTLFYKALERAGFSKNRLVAQLEIKLDRDDKLDDYKAFMEEQAGGVPYETIQSDELTLNALAPKAAHHFYPTLFTNESLFSTDVSESIRFSDDEANEMVDILRKRFGNEYLVFVIDEVGQYVGSQSDLILNLQGLATNLKSIGEGKIWIFGTGQQTLMEDNAAAALNSPELFKLKDRFPVAINLLANDITEICYRRLLTKSPEGQSTLENLYSQHGPKLQHNSKLEDAGIYSTSLDSTTFTNLYPFLPSHFDLLLNLLNQLAKSTSGIGLRSAIKVIQDVLVNRHHNDSCAAENNVGWLANVVTFFNGMEEEIKYAFQDKYIAYKNVAIRYPDQPLHASVAKSILVLQILDNMPATAANIAALIHDDIAGDSRLQEVETVLDDFISDPYIPVGQENGTYKFLSEKLNEIQQERAELTLRNHEVNRTLNLVISELFTPLPKARVSDARSETPGLKSRIDGRDYPVSGDRKEVQLIATLAGDAQYETARQDLVNESTQSDCMNKVFLIGHDSEQIRKATTEIQRSKSISEKHKNSPDQDVVAFCRAQEELSRKNEAELERLLRGAFFDGSLVFRGAQQSCTTVGATLESATKALLEDAANRIYDKHAYAAVNAKENAAELFLQKNLNEITSQADPLGLITGTGADRKINTQHPALVALQEHIEPRGQVDGNALMEFFQKPPYGWQKDTIRYLIAALFKSAVVKFKSSGQDITAPGEMALACIKTNNKFKNTNVSIRTEHVDMEVLGRAAQRLTELTGTTVTPFESSIQEAAKTYLLRCQTRIRTLPAQLNDMSCAGTEAITNLQSMITDLLGTDASDAPNEFGSGQSTLYESIVLANNLSTRFQDPGFTSTLSDHCEFSRVLSELGDTPVVETLRSELTETLSLVNDIRSKSDFYQPEHIADLNSALTTMRSAVSTALTETIETQTHDIHAAERDLVASPDWPGLNGEEQNQQLSAIANLTKSDFEPTIHGFRDAQNYISNVHNGIRTVKGAVKSLADERRQKRLELEREEAKIKGEKPARVIQIPVDLSDRNALSKLIQDLQQLKEDLASCPDIDVTFSRGED